MKKIIIIVVLGICIASCSSHRGRVCGGAGGGRCVENNQKSNIEIPVKANS